MSHRILNLAQSHTVNVIVMLHYYILIYISTTVNDMVFAFSALTLLVGWQEGHPACKKYGVMRCWHGYLSEAKCK